MRVFVTGGTGLIGSAVVGELISHGHTVLGLARSDESARALEAAGAEPHRGTLADLDAVRAGAAGAEGSVHLAFANDFSSAEAVRQAVEEESAAVRAIGELYLGRDRPFVVCSGTPWAEGRPSTEADPLLIVEDSPLTGRGRTVTAVLELAEKGLRASAVRLPRTVHNQGRGGFAGLLAEMARRSGICRYPADGSQRWPAVHALDAAALFRLALESAPAGGVWHAVADEGDTVRDIAGVIGRRLGVPVEEVPAESFGPLGAIFSLDQPSSSAYTRRTLGWEPTHPSLLDDLGNL